MSSRKKNIGDVSLYTWDWDYVITQKYQSKKIRNDIIQKWINHYRLKDRSYIITIKPIVEDGKD